MKNAENPMLNAFELRMLQVDQSFASKAFQHFCQFHLPETAIEPLFYTQIIVLFPG